MNDFTKEELEYIADGMALLIGQKSLANKLDTSIMNVFEKIESMIENYCDHEFSFAGSSEIDSCDKCGVIR